MYFKNFPKFRYQFSNNRTIRMADIFRSVKLSKQTLDTPEAFEYYILQDGDRPESIAEKYYGSPDYYWLVLLSNDIIDINTEWGFSSEEAQSRIESLYSGFAFYFDEEMDIKPGDYIVKLDSGFSGASGGGVGQEFGVVDKYLPTMNKIECRTHNFSALATGTSITDSFYVFRDLGESRYQTLTAGFETEEYLVPKRIDELKKSVLFFKNNDVVVNPAASFTGTSLTKTNLLYSTTGKKSGRATVIKQYHEGNDVNLKTGGVTIETYESQIESNFITGGKQIKLLRKSFVSFAETELEKLLRTGQSSRQSGRGGSTRGY
tara:strand:+ start:123 stop:1079 length:957 start_codon:yes stop_codon:yes gene_type:complete